MALFLGWRWHDLGQECAALEAQNASLGRLAERTDADLRKEKTDLEGRVEAVRSFLAGRVAWTAYTTDVAARLPSGALLTSFQGSAELDSAGPKKGGGSKGKKSFFLRASAPMAPSPAVPRELYRF